MIDNRAESQPPISQIVPETGLRHEPASVMRSFRDNSRRLRLYDCRSLAHTHRHATMMPSIHSLLAIAFAILPFLSLVHAQYPTELVGTWTTKSKKVLTGPVRLNTPYPLL